MSSSLGIATSSPRVPLSGRVPPLHRGAPPAVGSLHQGECSASDTMQLAASRRGLASTPSLEVGAAASLPNEKRRGRQNDMWVLSFGVYTNRFEGPNLFEDK